MKKAKSRGTGDEISAYTRSCPGTRAKICGLLRKEIDRILTTAVSRIYYSIPVWLIDENPVVGYSASKDHVTLLFWSGQAFKTPGLAKEGKFKAAEIKYADPAEIDFKRLRNWLKESKRSIYNYRDIRKNRGRLTLVRRGG
jgi:hypothetical protein